VELAREQVATLIGADPKEIVWTSGATESNNLAIKGAARFYAASRGKHLITPKTEHKSVLDTCRELEREGFTVTYLDVEPNGLIDLEKLAAAIRPDTVLVSTMYVNNEIGVIQDVAAIGALCRERASSTMWMPPRPPARWKSTWLRPPSTCCPCRPTNPTDPRASAPCMCGANRVCAWKP
jgi:cysteine sulfinate desulfinase/cysteine desulfurase-like protein